MGDKSSPYRFSCGDDPMRQELPEDVKETARINNIAIQRGFSFYNVETRTIKQGRLVKELDSVVFKSKKTGVVGPVRFKNNYHVIEVLKLYEKGSRLGLEEVYDEIYQRLKKRNSVATTTYLIDSLRKNSNIFINSLYN